MKKLFAIALFSVLVSGLSAQEPVIRMDDTNYWFTPYGDATVSFTYPFSVCNIIYVPDSTTAIVGIAVTGYDSTFNDSNFHYSTVLYERMNYDDTAPGFWLTECMPRTWNERHRFFEYCATEDTLVTRVEEFYFDRIHYVSDTFIVGVADIYHDGEWNLGYGLIGIWRVNFIDISQYTTLWVQKTIRGYSDHADGIYEKHISCERFNIGTSIQDSCHRFIHGYASWGGIFPIIGFRCDSVVTGLRSYPSQGRVLWNDNGTEMYKVAVGYGNKPVDSAFAIFTTTDTVVNLDTMPHGVTLGVWVRSMCRYTTSTYDTVVWGPWSSKAILYMPRANIDVVEPGVDFLLSPNPAAGTVKISCDEPVLNVEMLNVAGRRVLSCKGPLPADGLIDLCQLPSGLYTVHLTTPSGIGIQRLVVE